MDNKSARKKVRKAKEGKRVFRLKATKPTDSRTGATSAGAANGGRSSTMDTAASVEPSLPLPPPPTSSSDLLLSMEQQLRAGITPTLPTSAHERADLLASSLLPNGNGGSSAQASAGPLSKPSPDVSNFVVPIAPSLTKKRARPQGRDSGMFGGDAGGRDRRSRARRGGRAAAAGGGSALPFYVENEWEFKSKKGAAAIKKPTFFWELWMMMAAFGDPRGSVACKCVARGEKACACIEGVAAMEAIVKAMGVRLVEVCREWSDGKRLHVKHVRMAMPGEMREYMAWKDAHSKRGTKNEVERGADLRLEGLEDYTDSDSDDDNDDDDMVDGKAAAAAATTKPKNGARNSAENGETTSAASLGVGGDGGGAAALGGREGANEDGKRNDKNKPWQKKMKPQQQQQQQQSASVGEPREWEAEEEEVASRMEHRKSFADERTASMEEEDYVNTFFEFRKAFFVSSRGGGHTARVAKARGKSCPGSRVFLARYIGLGADSKEAGDKKLLEVLAYMLYDHVGRVVEAAIRKRTGGRLVCDASDPMLSAEEIAAAGATLPLLPGREQRESVRACRAANPDGISHNRPLARFPVGLEHRGQPLRWPRNTIQGGRVLVEGGEVVDASDQGLAEEAMALLESDFADF